MDGQKFLFCYQWVIERFIQLIWFKNINSRRKHATVFVIESLTRSLKNADSLKNKTPLLMVPFFLAEQKQTKKLSINLLFIETLY